MRNQTTAVAVCISLVLALFPSRQAKADGYIEDYVVWYTCVISPEQPYVVGNWHVDCQGNRTGDGMLPYSECTYTEFIQGDECIAH